MQVTFETLSISSVTPSYSWDDGNPLQNVQTVTLSSLYEQSQWSEIPIFTGYAPFVNIQLSSTVVDLNTFNLLTVRKINFGDYYNGETNTVKIYGNEDVVVSHNYIMPGLYQITFTEEEYIKQNGDELYVEIGEGPQILYNTTWQWWNILYGNYENILNREVTWEQTSLGQSNQLTWETEPYPCLNLDTRRGTIYWKWKYLADLYSLNTFRNRKIAWNQTQCDEFFQKSWKSAKEPCVEGFPELSTTKTNSINSFLIQVLEIPPKASLSAIDAPSEKNTPYTVLLSPRLTECGSFPIEKIVWDLGDGSPLLTQDRNNPALKAPFVYNGLFTTDYKDPRNFDVLYSYKNTEINASTFQASITAYASSTNTSSEDGVVLTDILPERYDKDVHSINIIQNVCLPTKRMVISQIGDQYCVHEFLKK